MSKVTITRSKLDALANTISTKSGAALPLTLDQMDAAVRSISGGGVTVEPLSVTANGTYAAPSGTAYSPVTVNVPTPAPSLQSKTATPTESQQTVSPDSGYDGLSSVTVNAIPSQYVVPTGELAITANGTVDVSAYASASVNVPTGSGEQDSGDRTDPIRFFDYDGRLVASYKAVPSAMPDVPTHDRLTNGTWNYTLEQVAEQFDAVGKCDVGANYDTASGKTEIDVELDSAHLDPYLCVAVKGTIIVDWGDGSATDTITGTSWTALKSTQHVYAQAGDYTISIDGAVGFYSNGSNYPTVLRGHGLTSDNRQYDREYCNCVTVVRVADGSRIGDYAFNYCYGLQSVSIPVGVTSIGRYAFQYCHSLKSVTIPSSVTVIFNNAFQYCYSLQSVTIPNNVTRIDSNVFNSCYGAYEYHLLPTTPPALGSTNAFSGIVAGTVIYVPKGCLEAYQTASNWSKYASYMQEDEAS